MAHALPTAKNPVAVAVGFSRLRRFAHPQSPELLILMTPVSRDDVERLILDCLTELNLMRSAEVQLEVTPNAPLYGEGSPLDSLGLVTLIFDIEEGLAERGIDINLSDAKAMSQSRSPYRTVKSMTDLILELCTDPAT